MYVSVLPFCHVSPGDPTQAIRFGSNGLYLLDHFAQSGTRNLSSSASSVLEPLHADRGCYLYPSTGGNPWDCHMASCPKASCSETGFGPQALNVMALAISCTVARGQCVTMSLLSQVLAPPPTSSLSQNLAESQRASSALCLLPSSCYRSPLPLPFPVPSSPLAGVAGTG